MHTKTMEGLIGAGTNINHVNTPLRVYKEAERRGDIGTMERAMGYVGEFSKKEVADDGLKEDAKEAKEKEKLEREKAIEKRRNERQEAEEKMEERKEANVDTVEISDEGKRLLAEAGVPDAAMGTETEKPDTGNISVSV